MKQNNIIQLLGLRPDCSGVDSLIKEALIHETVNNVLMFLQQSSLIELFSLRPSLSLFIPLFVCAWVGLCVCLSPSFFLLFRPYVRCLYVSQFLSRTHLSTHFSPPLWFWKMCVRGGCFCLSLSISLSLTHTHTHTHTQTHKHARPYW